MSSRAGTWRSLPDLRDSSHSSQGYLLWLKPASASAITSSDLDYEAVINSVAEIGEYLYVGVERASRDGWIKKIIRINPSDNTCEDVTVEITGIIKE